MSATLSRLTGSGTGGAYVAGTTAPPADLLEESNFVTPLKNNIDLLLAGLCCNNVFAGGSMDLEFDASAAGTVDLRPWLPIRVDNRNNQISGFSDSNGATLVVQFRFLVWSLSSAVSVTPVVYDITGAATATTSGAVACTAGAEDYSGSNQQQTLVLTLPNALHYFKPQITIGGTPAAGLRVRGLALFDCFISLP